MNIAKEEPDKNDTELEIEFIRKKIDAYCLGDYIQRIDWMEYQV